MKLNKLRDCAYKTACEHGWHEKELSHEHWMWLVITELAEATEADRKEKYADSKRFNAILLEQAEKYKIHGASGSREYDFNDLFLRFIKDSVEDELADACIRLLDYAGMVNYDLDDFDYENSDTENYSEMTFTEAMYKITSYVMKWDIPEILNEIFAFCKYRKIDVIWHIEQKMNYNERRPYKHGK